MVYHFTKYECLFGIIKPYQIIFNANHYSAWKEDYNVTKEIVEPIIKDICVSSNNHYDETMELDPYVVSFTKLLHMDSMWGKFGDNHTGVALAFNEEIIKSTANRDHNPDIFMKCYYSNTEEEIKKWMLECRESIFPAYTINNLEDDLRTISIFVLPQKFYDESEYRYVIPIHRDVHCWLEKGKPQFQEASIGSIKELEFPMSALEFIYFGKDITEDEIEIAKNYVKLRGFEIPDDHFVSLN